MPPSKRFQPILTAVLALVLLFAWIRMPAATTAPATSAPNPPAPFDAVISGNSQSMLEEGRRIFRYDTFGDEAFWGDTIKLNQAIAGQKLGGVGPGMSPKTALSVGLKVDADALPASLVDNLKNGKVDLGDPATTLALLKLNSVLGVTGRFASDGKLTSVGIQCALCHSTVDDSFSPGIGHRLDGWANRDLNVGAIIALAPDLSVVRGLLSADDATVRKVLSGWGAGKFDAELFTDGKALRPDGKSAATLIPPALGLAGVNLHTWVFEMHGKGTFLDSRLNDSVQFPVAARAGFGHVRNDADFVTSKLPALHFYQLAIPAPVPPEGSFDAKGAERGKLVFDVKAKCATCHVPPIFTEPGRNLHTAAEIGSDDFQANRAPDERYRTAPLKGLFAHAKGGFFHDGRFATLRDVVDHYDGFFKLGLSAAEKTDLVEYLKSL